MNALKWRRPAAAHQRQRQEKSTDHCWSAVAVGGQNGERKRRPTTLGKEPRPRGHTFKPDEQQKMKRKRVGNWVEGKGGGWAGLGDGQMDTGHPISSADPVLELEDEERRRYK
jgi:hypothetical protein